MSQHWNGYDSRQGMYGCCLKIPRWIRSLTEIDVLVDWVREAYRSLGRTDVCMCSKLSMRRWTSDAGDDTKDTEVSRSCSLEYVMVAA